MANKKVEKIGVIKGIDLVKNFAPKFEATFKTGKYMTEKDRPRKKVNKNDLGKWLQKIFLKFS